MIIGGDWVATIYIENVQPFKKDNIQQHQIIKMFQLKIKGMIFKQTLNPRIYKGMIDRDSYYTM